jgi:dethiobiotin synthase
MSTPGIFVTGTDTGVGKTVVSGLLISAIRDWKGQVGYFKPVQTGSDSDTQTIAQLTGLNPPSLAVPVYEFPEPIAPHRAASLHGAHIEIEKIQSAWESLPNNFWIVEGAGGICTPLSNTTQILDIPKALELPIVIVAASRLGTINHTLLTYQQARAKGLRVLGIIVTGEEDPELVNYLKKDLDLPAISKSEIPTWLKGVLQ